jgi:hypothetical protein
LSRADLAARLRGLDFDATARDLDAQGFATVEKLLGPGECHALIALYDDARCFRKRVVMAQHGFGQGEYQYFGAPLPPLVAELRSLLYERLAPVANRWGESLASGIHFPERLDEYLARCHAAGQTRPTPLLLRYSAGDYNRLHQDLYGEEVFPLQTTILLSQPGRDFTGGEFLLTEQRPRMQSRAEVVPLALGDAVVFPVRERPVQGTRGYYRVQMRHGISRLRSGHRTALGVIFHDAR